MAAWQWLQNPLLTLNRSVANGAAIHKTSNPGSPVSQAIPQALPNAATQPASDEVKDIMPYRAGRPCAWRGCPAIVRESRYCDEHLAHVRKIQDAERGTAHERGYGARWRRVRAMYLRKHPLCVECQRLGFATPATDVDHVVSRRRGGTDAESNLQSLCHRHHSAKTMKQSLHRG